MVCVCLYYIHYLLINIHVAYIFTYFVNVDLFRLSIFFSIEYLISYRL